MVTRRRPGRWRTPRPLRGGLALRTLRNRLAPRTLRGRLAALTALAAFGCLNVAGIAVFVAASRLLGHQAESQLRQVASLVQPLADATSGPVLEDGCRGLAGQATGTGTGLGGQG